MDFDEYQFLAMRTSPYKDNRLKLYHSVFGMTSEAGEVAGIMQKTFQGHDLDEEHMAKEIGDVLWMITEACDALNLSLDDVAQMNIEKLKKRYPNGFETERSLHRSDDDI